MAFLTRNVKVWIIASLISLIIYDAYILRGSFTILFGYLINVPQDVTYVNITGAVFWAGFVGLGARFIAVILGLPVAYLIWVKAKPFIKIKNLVALGLFLEGINFLALIPSIWFLIRPSFVTSLPLGFGYILQIAFALPFLWILALKVIKYHERNQKPALLKYASPCDQRSLQMDKHDFHRYHKVSSTRHQSSRIFECSYSHALSRSFGGYRRLSTNSA